MAAKHISSKTNTNFELTPKYSAVENKPRHNPTLGLREGILSAPESEAELCYGEEELMEEMRLQYDSGKQFVGKPPGENRKEAVGPILKRLSNAHYFLQILIQISRSIGFCRKDAVILPLMKYAIFFRQSVSHVLEMNFCDTVEVKRMVNNILTADQPHFKIAQFKRDI